jgi:hypothetical protein
MRFPRLVGAAALGGTLLVGSVWAQDAKPAVPVASAAPAAQNDGKLFGRFTAVVSEAEKKVRQKSVDQAVSEVSYLLRAIGRKRIEAKTHIPAWVEIKQGAPGTVTFHFEGRAPEPCSLNGSTKGKDPEGKDAEFAARWDGKNLIQTVATEDGKRTNVLEPQADGSLKLRVELRSTRFETPIRYTLSYKRAK